MKTITATVRVTLEVTVLALMLALAPTTVAHADDEPEPVATATQPSQPASIRKTVTINLSAHCDVIDWQTGTQVQVYIWDGSVWVKGPKTITDEGPWQQRRTTPRDWAKYGMDCKTPEEREFGKRPTAREDLGDGPPLENTVPPLTDEEQQALDQMLGFFRLFWFWWTR